MDRREFLSAISTTVGMTAIPSSAYTAFQDRGIVRYPDPWVETIDSRFTKLYRPVGTTVERLYTGSRWAEGPVWFGGGRYLLWSDISNNRILRWLEETGEVSVFRSPSNYCNGNTRDLQGRLITCERRRVTRTEYNGTISTLIDRFDGKRLNSPNDAVVHPDGHIWFTDPGYGIMSLSEGGNGREEFELPTNVYRLNPETGRATVVTNELERPNGLCFSPDYTKLYIADTGTDPPHPMFVYDVIDGETLKNGRTFYNMGAGVADGIRCDVDGNIWSSAGWAGEGYDGVHIIAPDGELIGQIHLPEVCANLCFGGVKRNRLFMTASQSLYAVYIETQGAQAW